MLIILGMDDREQARGPNKLGRDKFTGCVRFPIHSAGITLVEMLLAVALIAVVTALALPVYSNYSIRMKISESLELTQETKKIVIEACKAREHTGTLQEELGSHYLVQRAIRQPRIRDIRFSGNCESPVITITTMNTGQTPSPVLRLSTVSADGVEQLSWRCESGNTPEQRLPRDCRD